MTIREWLTNTSIDHLDTELILLHVLGKTERSFLIAHDDYILSDEQLAACNALSERRQNGEPLSYLTGTREFYGRPFKVSPATLIPRVETEDIIDIAKAINPQSILDIGTGSGCIAITLALELPNAQVTATDISKDALAVARENAERLNAHVDFYQSDLLTNYAPTKGTLIIANLPYVDPDWDWLDKNSLDYEPAAALYANNHGLELIYKLIDQAKGDYELLLEADPCQHDDIIKYAKKYGYNADTKNFIIHLMLSN